MFPPQDIRTVAPALEKYAQGRLLGEVWKRPGLSPRDRSIVTLAVLIARNQTVEMPYYLNLALDNGVKPAEISEMITHLRSTRDGGTLCRRSLLRRTCSLSAGSKQRSSLPRCRSLLPSTRRPRRNALRGTNSSTVPWRPECCSTRRTSCSATCGCARTLRPGSSLVTVSALVASGQVAQMPYHLNRAMDSGLTQEQASEVFTQLAFYAGWPNVFSALPVAKDVFEKRPK